MSSRVNKKTYIVFLDLPKNVVSEIDFVKKKYGSSSLKKWPAHLTLKYEEELIINPDILLQIMSEFAQAQQPIQLKIGNLKVNRQKNGWNIYLAIENKEYQDIVKELNQKLKPYVNKASKNAFHSTNWEQSKNYYPHISIKGGSKLKDLSKVFDLVKLEDLNFPETIECCSFTVAFWDKDRWKKVKTYQFGNKTKEPEMVSMSWGYPDLKDFPLKKFSDICHRLQHKNPQKFLQYNPTIGLKKLRKLIVTERISDYLIKDSNDVIISPGGTFSIFLIAFLFKNIFSYKNIGVILPCYDTALEIFKILNFKIVDLNQYFDNKEQLSIDCLYLNPRFNNPMGTTIQPSVCSIIKHLIANKKLYAIEDDVCHIFKYSENNDYISLKKQLPDQIFYLDSFSKILVPGFRLGYLLPPKHLVKKTSYLQKYFCSSASTLSQEIVYELLRNGGYRKIVKKTLSHYKNKMKILEKALEKYRLKQFSQVVNGGFYQWLEIPQPLTDRLEQQLQEKNVRVVDGRKYFIRPQKKSFIRISIANISEEKIDSSIRIIKEVLYDQKTHS